MLLAHGLQPENQETVMMIAIDEFADAAPQLAPTVEIVECSSTEEIEEIANMQSVIWGSDWSWFGDYLKARMERSEGDTVLYAAKSHGQIVGSARLEVTDNSCVGGLWGGSVADRWRRQGIYRNLLAVRVERARDLGLKYLVIDASADSRPILQRLGFVEVATTVPYVWSPIDRLL